MRKPIIAGNWKMNKTPAEAAALINELKPLVADASCDVVVCVPAAAAVGIYLMLKGRTLQGIAMIGAAAVLAGLSVFLFFGCRALSKGTAFLTKKIFSWIKSLFIRKEKAQ